MWNDERSTSDTRRLGGGIEMWKKWVAKRKVCHKAWQKSKSAEDKHALDVAKKEVYTAVMTSQESKLQEFTADLQSESGRKNCFRIAKQMAREGRDVISVCCMKNDDGNVEVYGKASKCGE